MAVFSMMRREHKFSSHSCEIEPLEDSILSFPEKCHFPKKAKENYLQFLFIFVSSILIVLRI